MRKQSSLATEEKTAIDLTPMLDVVFIMLIFFIVTASFVKEPGKDVIRPVAKTAEAKKASILIAVTNKSKVWIDRKEIDKDSILPSLQKLYLENPKASIVIQADKDAESQALIKVMDAARLVGVVNVAISAKE